MTQVSELDFMGGIIDDYNDIAVKKIVRNKNESKEAVKKIIDHKFINKLREKIINGRLLRISLKNYEYSTWNKFFGKDSVNLLGLIHNFEWYNFFDRASKNDYFKNIENVLTRDTQEKKSIYPYPDLVFNAFNILSPSKIKVVILGQDPYHNCIDVDDKSIPQAMGLSFSVPDGVSPPPSLVNIIKNLRKYGHIETNNNKNNSDIISGNLIEWTTQGVFLLNTALTVLSSTPKSHSKIWNNFTIDLIDYLSTRYENIIFVGWGTDAYDIIKRIDFTQTSDSNRHRFIITSHPSPFSVDSTFKRQSLIDQKKQIDYPSFNSCNIFEKINEYVLEIHGHKINWNI